MAMILHCNLHPENERFQVLKIITLFSYSEWICRGVNKEHTADQEEFPLGQGRGESTTKIQDTQASQVQEDTEKETLSKLEEWDLVSVLSANWVQLSMELGDLKTFLLEFKLLPGQCGG